MSLESLATPSRRKGSSLITETVDVLLIKDDLGGPCLVTKDGKKLKNIIVKSCEKVEGQFAMELKVIGLSNLQCNEGKNW